MAKEIENIDTDIIKKIHGYWKEWHISKGGSVRSLELIVGIDSSSSKSEGLVEAVLNSKISALFNKAKYHMDNSSYDDAIATLRYLMLMDEAHEMLITSTDAKQKNPTKINKFLENHTICGYNLKMHGLSLKCLSDVLKSAKEKAGRILAHHYINQRGYIDAADILDKLATDCKISGDFIEVRAKLHYHNQNYQTASNLYEKLFRLESKEQKQKRQHFKDMLLSSVIEFRKNNPNKDPLCPNLYEIGWGLAVFYSSSDTMLSGIYLEYAITQLNDILSDDICIESANELRQVKQTYFAFYRDLVIGLVDKYIASKGAVGLDNAATSINDITNINATSDSNDIDGIVDVNVSTGSLKYSADLNDRLKQLISLSDLDYDLMLKHVELLLLDKKYDELTEKCESMLSADDMPEEVRTKVYSLILRHANIYLRNKQYDLVENRCKIILDSMQIPEDVPEDTSKYISTSVSEQAMDKDQHEILRKTRFFHLVSSFMSYQDNLIPVFRKARRLEDCFDEGTYESLFITGVIALESSDGQIDRKLFEESLNDTPFLKKDHNYQTYELKILGELLQERQSKLS
ncbi:MAG: hypothetical protein ABIG89_02820 [Candidatus Woesearchaeota archaeon]